VILDCAHYRDGQRQHAGPMDLEHAAAVCRGGEDGFVWLGLFEPSDAELAEVQTRFGLHDLAIEDAQSLHLRPKVERYEDSGITFVVLRTARYVDATEEVDFGEVSVFIGSQFVLTIRQGLAGALAGARERLEARPDLLAEGPIAALWAIMDTVVDDYLPVLTCLERDIEELEAIVFAGSVAPSDKIYAVRREVSDFYRAVHPLLGPLDAFARGAHGQVRKRLRPFFRDINDHIKLVEEEIVAQRDLLAVMLQANISVISVQQNETSKQLTVIATVFLPLTFLTGFFGMNFGWMVDHVTSLWTFLVFGLGSLLVSLIALRLWFQRRGYF
jgi:magnesium transporter